MKKFLAIVVLIVLLSALFIVAATAIDYQGGDAKLTIMSFNIRTFSIETNAVNMWGNRQESVLSVIAENDPDIIGFQELKQAQFDFMKEQLAKEYDFYGTFRDDVPYFSESTAVFYKRKRFKVLEKNTYWLSETPEKMSVGWDASTNRIWTQLKFKDRRTGKEFAFINTHLDHKGDVARHESVMLLNRRINAMNCPAMLTGDFNFNENSPHYDWLTADSLADTKYLAADSDTGGTFNGFKENYGSSPIDYIMVTEGHFDVDLYNIIRTRNPKGMYPSDHFPIKAVVRLK